MTSFKFHFNWNKHDSQIKYAQDVISSVRSYLFSLDNESTFNTSKQSLEFEQLLRYNCYNKMGLLSWLGFSIVTWLQSDESLNKSLFSHLWTTFSHVWLSSPHMTELLFLGWPTQNE